METTYYTLTAREILVEGAAVQRASGDGARQLVCVRSTARPAAAGAGKVIDLAAWKAERDTQDGEDVYSEAWYDAPQEEHEPDAREAEAAAAMRTRRSRRASAPDLWASAAVVCVMVILAVRLLTGF